MAKKNLPAKANLNDTRWINTPFVYTKFCAGFTLLQQDLMFRVSDHIQDYIKKYFTDGRFRSKDIPRPLFTSQDIENGLKPIRVNLADLGIISSNYGTIDAAVADIFQLTVRVPRIDENGNKVLEWFPVFSRAALPITDKGYTYTNEAGVVIESVKKRGYIEFEINPHVADYAFDMSQGYINHPNVIAQIAKADCTPLLYTLLKKECLEKRNVGYKARLEPKAIKEHLGLVYKDAQKNITGYMYDKYSKFRERILEKAQKDLERMANLDQIDYTFTFSEIRREGKSTGDPLFIEFELHKTRLGEARDSIQHRNAAERKLIDAMCEYCPDIKRDELKRMVEGVDSSVFVDFTLYAYRDVRNMVERKQPDDVAHYMLSLLRKWIESHQPQPDLFASQDSCLSTPISSPGESKETSSLTPAVLTRFAALTAALADCFADTITKNYIKRLALADYDPDKDIALIAVENKNEVNYLEESVVRPHSALMSQHFKGVGYKVRASRE